MPVFLTRILSTPFVYLVVILVIGSLFRVYGIIDNHSFWTDESNVALYAREIVFKGFPVLDNGYSTSIYQVGTQYLVALFFFIFGFSEFVARLPFVIFGSLAILGGYLLTKRLSGSPWSGILAATLVAFSQIELAYSTQVRPYIIIQALSFFIFYWLLEENSKKNNLKLIFILILSLLTILLHMSSILMVVAVVLFIFRKRYLNLVAITIFFMTLSSLMYIGFLGSHGLNILDIFKFSNNISYIFLLFSTEYGILLIPAVLGYILLLKDKPKFMIALSIWFLCLLLLWTFFHSYHNIRYLIPFIGWLFILFSCFIGKMGRQVYKSERLIVFITILVLLMTSDKFVNKPATYYSPNSDLAYDVQWGDYKAVYNRINSQFGQDVYIIDSWNDRILWYMNKKPAAIFIKKELISNQKSKVDMLSGATISTNLEQFKSIISQNPRGLVLIEEWINPMPDDIKDYIKQNLKFEFEDRGLDNTTTDHWPIKVYSWGM